MIVRTNEQQNQNNSINSDIIQILLDLQAVGFDVQGLLDSCLSDTERLNKAESLFKLHQYAKKPYIFAMLGNATINNVLIGLSPNACKLLVFYIQNMYINNYVSCTKRMAMLVLSMSKPTYLATKRELLKYGCIVVVSEYKKGSPEILMVNPEIAWVGKYKHIEISNFWKLVNNDDIRKNYNELNICRNSIRYINDGKKPFYEIIEPDINEVIEYDMNKVSRPNKVGRPSRLTEEQKDTVVCCFNNGDTQKEIAMQFGVSVSTIRKIIRERR